MNTIRSLAAGLVVAATAISAASAAPNIRLYDATADSDTVIDLSICSRSASIEVAGNGGTDLDFYVYNANGDEIYSDEKPVDFTTGTFTQDFEGCAEYTLHVFNEGAEENRFVVRITDL